MKTETYSYFGSDIGILNEDNHLNHLPTIVKPLALAPLSLQSLDATESLVLGWAERFLSWFPDAMDPL